MKRKTLTVVLLVMTIGWMALIFGFSSQSGEASGGLSAMIAQPVTALIAYLAGLTNDAAISALYLQVDGAVRMIAHFAEYAVLGVLLTLTSRRLGWRYIWFPWLIGFIYALTDEWHQSFSPGRVCDMTDVLIDLAGVICGSLICDGMIQLWRKKHVYHS